MSRVGVALIGAALLTLATGCTSTIAELEVPAPTPAAATADAATEARFLTSIEDSIVRESPENRAATLELGYKVCYALDRGVTFQQVVDLLDVSDPYFETQAQITSKAVHILCPEHLDTYNDYLKG